MTLYSTLDAYRKGYCVDSDKVVHSDAYVPVQSTRAVGNGVIYVDGVEEKRPSYPDMYPFYTCYYCELLDSFFHDPLIVSVFGQKLAGAADLLKNVDNVIYIQPDGTMFADAQGQRVTTNLVKYGLKKVFLDTSSTQWNLSAGIHFKVWALKIMRQGFYYCATRNLFYNVHVLTAFFDKEPGL